MDHDCAAEPPSDVASVGDPVELLAVQAAAQRAVAARASLEAAETDLVRLTAEAREGGLALEQICDRLAELGIGPEQLPRALRVTLGYTGQDPR